jgi:hypothetical protein
MPPPYHPIHLHHLIPQVIDYPYRELLPWYVRR